MNQCGEDTEWFFLKEEALAFIEDNPGFRVLRVFEGEYVLLYHDGTGAMIRVYPSVVSGPYR